MKGSTHAVIGAVSPLWLAMPGQGVLPCAVMAVVAAGSSLGPDIDTTRSTATLALPRFVHGFAYRASRAARKASSTGKDFEDAAWRIRKGRDPEHRTLTHTGLSAIVFGLLVWGIASLPLGTACMASLCTYLVARVLRSRYLAPAVAGGAFALGMFVIIPPYMIGLAAGIGWLSHIIADGCTKDGVPLMWPAPMHGKRWWRVRLLGTRLESGSPREIVVAAAIIVALLLPVAHPYM